MVVKQRVIISVVLTDKNLLRLQNMSFLNKRGRSTGKKNLNEFVNRCVDATIGIEDSSENHKLEETLILSNIQQLYKESDKVKNRIRQEARKLEEHRKKNQKVPIPPVTTHTADIKLAEITAEIP